MAKYLVYTCVTSDYDKIRKVLGKQDPNIDFVCFTDRVQKQIDLRAQTGWIFMPIPTDLKNLDCRRQARMVKIGIYKYIKGYDGYLWIDAPIIIIGNIGEFIKQHPFSENQNIYVSKHYMRDCVYQEFAQVLRLNKDRHACVYEQYQKYHNMGYPKHAGMAETSILYRNCIDLKVQVHSTYWADEVLNFSYRDQLSFNWAAWTTKTPITYINEDIYKRDTENETSRYFFLPWQKHNNPNVAIQLKQRLDKNPIPNTNIEIQIPAPIVTKQENKINEFEKKYQEFIENLKKQKVENEKQEEVKQEIISEEINKPVDMEVKAESDISSKIEEAPKAKKRGRKKKVK